MNRLGQFMELPAKTIIDAYNSITNKKVRKQLLRSILSQEQIFTSGLCKSANGKLYQDEMVEELISLRIHSNSIISNLKELAIKSIAELDTLGNIVKRLEEIDVNEIKNYKFAIHHDLLGADEKNKFISWIGTSTKKLREFLMETKKY